MENKNKRSVDAIIIIVLMVLLLGVGVFFIVYNLTGNNKNNSIYQESTDVDLEKILKEKDEKIATLEKENKELKDTSKGDKIVSLVSDAVNEYDPKVGKDSCGDDPSMYNWVFKKVRLPKININTETVNKINKEIMETDTEVNLSHGGSDLIIDYDYREVSSRNILLLNISTVYSAHCATGYGGTKSYVYDMKNDKLLTLKELLKLYNVNYSNFEESVYNSAEDFEEEEDFENVKDDVKQLLSEESFEIADITYDSIEIFFPIGLTGFTKEVWDEKMYGLGE